jgi:hypothetical protein
MDAGCSPVQRHASDAPVAKGLEDVLGELGRREEQRHEEVDRRLEDRARALRAEPAEPVLTEGLDRAVEPEQVLAA